MLAALFAATLALAADPPEEGQFQLDMVTADMLRSQCEGGDATACHRLGRRYEQGIGGVKVSPPDAATWYRKGCDGSVTMDCGLAGWALATVGDGGAYPLAKKGCDAGDAVACYVVGHLQVVGLGVAADPMAGLAAVAKGCAAGIPNACAELGQLYAGAVPAVPADHAKARPLLDTSCTEGDYASCTWLANLLLTGKGGPTDTARGITVLGTACDAGFATACESLAAVYVDGIGVSKDPAKGVPYLRKACDAKLGTACGHLATMTLHGQAGLAADRAKALDYLKRSCTYGFAPACQEADAACRSGAKEACR